MPDTAALLARARLWSTPLVGLFGGWLASLADWPLPWMIGSLLAVILVRCSGWLLLELPGGRQTGQWLIASAIGLHFTAPVFAQIVGHWWVIVLGACITVMLCVIGIGILRHSGVDRATAYFASMPGGASEMVGLALRHQAEPAKVAAAHSLRLLMVVLIIPALFTFALPESPTPEPGNTHWGWLALLMPLGAALALLWRRLGQPNPWMLGPLTVCALASVYFDLDIALPPGGGELGQWLIGCALGCHFDRKFFRSAPAFMLRVVLFTLITMVVAALGAEVLSWFAEVDDLSLMLGMMPGGITELCLTAEALQLSVALVTALQVLRLFLVMFLAEPLYRLWTRLYP
ncbi:MAG: AbrB family transcriptional regulator [Pseudomonas sp.]